MFLALELLQHQFPNIDGWQSTLLFPNDGLIHSSDSREAIQIHLVCDSHWVISSSLGGISYCLYMTAKCSLSGAQNVHQTK